MQWSRSMPRVVVDQLFQAVKWNMHGKLVHVQVVLAKLNIHVLKNEQYILASLFFWSRITSSVTYLEISRCASPAADVLASLHCGICDTTENKLCWSKFFEWKINVFKAWWISPKNKIDLLSKCRRVNIKFISDYLQVVGIFI